MVTEKKEVARQRNGEPIRPWCNIHGCHPKDCMKTHCPDGYAK